MEGSFFMLLDTYTNLLNNRELRVFLLVNCGILLVLFN